MLFVDDCRSSRDAAGELLADEGYEVALAGNGHEALVLFAEARPIVVLTDVGMPGIGGYALLTAIKLQSPTTPVVLMSGYDRFDVEREAAELGAAAYLIKPVDLDLLLTVIRRVTGL